MSESRTSPLTELPPGLDEIEALALKVVSELPVPFAALAAAVLVRVADLAPDALLDDLGMEDPFTLTGLYEGIPLTQKSVSDMSEIPDTVWLFRRAILDEWIARGDVPLADLVRNVVVHEFAHHFGWSDADIAEIDRWWE